MTRRIRLPRRTALKVLGAALALPAGAALLRQTAADPTPVTWHGEALGAAASLTLWHPDLGFARRTIARMRVEIARLEGIFSLSRPDTEIARLNAEGRLARPSRDFVEVLDLSLAVAKATQGAFDPTIQPLWMTYAAHFSAPGADPMGPDPFMLDTVRSRVGFGHLSVSSATVAFDRPDMAISLNGIAQGYVTDRIADLLRNEGFAHAMVELGETRALGSAPDGAPFHVSLVNPAAQGRIDREIDLNDTALAVSGGYGLRFGGDMHHIFDPATGRSANRLLDVSVVAPRAMLADALSTAIFVAGPQIGTDLLRSFPGTSALVTGLDGTVVSL